MAFGRFLLVLMGIILVLFSYVAHAQSCSEMSIIADDTILNENETDNNYEILLENNSGRAFYIESVEVSDNCSFFDADYSGREYNSVAAGADTLIYLDLAAFSVDYDRSGTVTVKVRGHFSNGNDCSFSDIQETFRVEVQNTGTESGDCSDIDVETHNFHVPESDTHYEYFTVSNSSSSNFIIEDIQVSDNSSYFSLDRTYTSTINPDSDSELKIIVYSTSVSSQQSGTGYVKVRGYFQNGRSCSFSNIGEQSFTVTVDNSGEGACGNIELDTENVIVDEETMEYNSFYIRNNSDHAFTVDEVQISKDSDYYSQSISNYDSTISSNSSGTVRVKTIANSVAGTKFETSTLKVRGRFSDGNSCGFSDLSREFQTRINDTEGTDNGETTSGDCPDLAIESHAVEVNANDSVTDSFFLRNDSTRNFYIDSARVYDNSELFQSSALDFDKIARRDGEKAAINFRVQAYGTNADASGTAYMQLKGHFSDARTCSVNSIGTESFAVNINAVQEILPTPIPPYNPGKAIEIVNAPGRVEFAGNTFIAVTVKNNSAFAKNISFGFNGFPPGIMLEANTYNVAGQSTKTVYLDIDSRGKTGTFNGTLFIQAESARDEKPITLVASAGTVIETENLAMDVQISENKGTYDLVLKIKNNFPQAVAGTVSVDLPSGWKLSGITELSLESGEEKTTILDVVPSEPPSKEIVSAVQFTTANGEQAKKVFAFKPLTGIAGTALLVLSQAAVWIGIIVLAAIALVFIAEKIRK